jgi:hypothetical protein
MTRGSAQPSQRQRTQANPQVLGSFSETSLRYLTGSLGPEYVVGLNGYGGGAMNHWYQINLQVPAWIITRKGGPRPNYIQLSAYDLNHTPIQGRMIFQADSGQFAGLSGQLYYPYLGKIAGSQSTLYNEFKPGPLNTTDDLYYTLNPGSYLLCISSTRNESLDYSLGIVIEVPLTELYLLLEDLDVAFLTLESDVDLNNTLIIGPTFDTNYVLPSIFNGFTSTTATVNNGITVTISQGSTWLIGAPIPESQDKFILEPTEDYNFNAIHEHSLTEWTEAWQRERSPGDPLPEIFAPLITRA